MMGYLVNTLSETFTGRLHPSIQRKKSMPKTRFCKGSTDEKFEGSIVTIRQIPENVGLEIQETDKVWLVLIHLERDAPDFILNTTESPKQ